VLAGDWLYMQAFKVALEEKNLRVLDLLIGLTQQMVEGELLQIQKLGKAVSEAEYFDLIYRKTACLFAVSMRLGAVLAGATEAQETNLAAYGRAVGLAFQIVDDAADRQTIQRVLDDRSFENISRQQIQQILVRNGSVEYAMATADRYAEQGRHALATLADSEFKRALLWVPDFVVARDK
jgi:octaprenyl-diphosphate synthase